jgi:uncharacterized protein YkwD
MSRRTGRGASRWLAVVGPVIVATVGLAPSGASAAAGPPASGGSAAPGTTVSAGTTASVTVDAAMRAHLLDRLNADRAAAGLVALRADPLLVAVAEPRAGRMAAAGVLDHGVAGGDIGAAVSAVGLRWYTVAEDIGMTTATWGIASVDWVFHAWETSSEHDRIMMDARMNYVGVGLAESATGATYASLVFAETADRTPPGRRMSNAWVTGRTATFDWSGRDVLLQSHTAGLAGFDVELRIDGGAWRMIRTNTGATSVSLAQRLPGHRYAVRVRARDRAANVSTWSSALAVVVR